MPTDPSWNVFIFKSTQDTALWYSPYGKVELRNNHCISLASATNPAIANAISETWPGDVRTSSTLDREMRSKLIHQLLEQFKFLLKKVQGLCRKTTKAITVQSRSATPQDISLLARVTHPQPHTSPNPSSSHPELQVRPGHPCSNTHRAELSISQAHALEACITRKRVNRRQRTCGMACCMYHIPAMYEDDLYIVAGC